MTVWWKYQIVKKFSKKFHNSVPRPLMPCVSLPYVIVATPPPHPAYIDIEHNRNTSMVALSTSCYVDDVIVSGNRPDYQNGVPFGPPFLSYPPTEIDAGYTIWTPIRPAYMGDSSILKICIRFDLPKQTLNDVANLGQFWHILGPLPRMVCAIKHTPSPNIVQNITLMRLAVRKITPTLTINK